MSGSETAADKVGQAQARGEAAPDAVTLLIGGVAYGGWQDVRITRGIEIMPGSFEIALTELYPGQAGTVAALPGQPCAVKIGGEVVITGYIDRYQPSLSAEAHQVRISGRGKCQDLVDCAAGFRADGSFAMNVNGGTALSLAKSLAEPFGITVTERGTERGHVIPSFMINFGETPYEVIDRVARYEQLLAYEGADGNLILSGAGTATMASGFQVPGNVEGCAATFAMDERFSDYFVTWTTTDTTGQVRTEIGGAEGVLHGHVRDKTVPRFRPRAIVSDQVVGLKDIGEDLAAWEMNRRNGRSQAVTLTCDKWRDEKGNLWQPNALAPVLISDCKVAQANGAPLTWIIAEVTYRRGEDGTHADLVLMSPDAFKPQPTGLQGTDYQTFKGLQEAAAREAGSSHDLGHLS